MRPTTVFAFVLILSHMHCIAQIEFEEGYYIDTSGERHEGLIRNAGWKNNPTRFEYRDPGSDATLQMEIHEAQEFGFKAGATFVRAEVKIDRSSADLANLGSDRNPVWSEEQLFLKVLTTGKASLYYYQQGNLIRFFYKQNELPIRQLLFKKYIKNNNVATNSDFRQQLWSNLTCDGEHLNSAKSLGYNESALLKYFRDYNKCNGAPEEVRPPRTRGIFHLRLTPGLNVATLKLRNSEDSRYGNLIFGPDPSFRAGAEIEFILPYNKGKWAVVFEPGFQYFKGEQESGAAAGRATVQYQSIELPVGARYYFFVGERRKVFLNAFIGVGISRNSFFSFENDPVPKGIVQRVNPAVGTGYDFNKWSLELRYNIMRNITGDYLFWKSEYNMTSFIIGYTIF